MTPIKMGDLNVSEMEMSRVLGVLESGQLSPGPVAKEFEAKFSLMHGAGNGIFVNSGTDALRLSLLAMKELYGWKDGDEVAVPAITFVASINVILQSNLVPVLVDVTPYTYTISPFALELALDKPNKIKAVMLVHMFGQICDDETFEIASRNGIKVIEDSCESMGVGKVKGDVACYSTYVCHVISTGVGGMAITNNDELSRLIRSYANHGRDFAYIPGHSKPVELTKAFLKSRFRFDRMGYSCRGTEMQAAIGIEQLGNLERFVAKRQELAALLVRGLGRFSALGLPRLTDSHCFMMFPVVLRSEINFDKWDLCLELERAGIETREMMPILGQPCYQGLGFERFDCPVASWINQSGFYIPCHPLMAYSDVVFIAGMFEKFFTKNSR